MSDVEQSREKKNREFIHSLQKQVQELRRLLEKSETALAEKLAQEQAGCLHTRQVLVTYGGPRDNGELDYQCMDCGVPL